MFHVQSFQRLFFPFLLFDFIFSCQSINVCFTVQTFTSYVGNHFLYHCKYIKKTEAIKYLFIYYKLQQLSNLSKLLQR